MWFIMATKTSTEVDKKPLETQNLNGACKHMQSSNYNMKLQSSRKPFVSSSIVISPSPKKKNKECQNIIPPKKFLLGGNISDPLNLNSLQDEDINKAMNKTPNSSTLHANVVNIKKDQVNVIIPRNLSDPLELSGCAKAKIITCLDIHEDSLKHKTPQKSKRPLSKLLHESVMNVENGDISKYDIINKEKLETENIFSSPPSKKFKIESTKKFIHESSEEPCIVTEVMDKIIQELENNDSEQLIDDYNILISKSPIKVIVEEELIKPLKTLHPSPEKNTEHSKNIKETNKKLKPENCKAGQVVLESKKPCSPQQFTPTKQKHKLNKSEPKFKEKKALFKYGNYNRYYGYRNPDDEDHRLKVLAERMNLFYDKDVLDIGCNIGRVTFSVARDFGAKSIVGMDIDRKLINIARKNVQYYVNDVHNPTHLASSYHFSDYTSHNRYNANCNQSFPISLPIIYGPITLPTMTQSGRFPYNISFVQGNYVLQSDDLLSMETSKFDVILCLSITKWLHLNWGDDGLKRAFKRMYAQLRPGGTLVVEAQPWKSYGRRKTLTETIWQNYKSIEFKPPMFTEYLLNEVGFVNCETLAVPHNPSKGFQRPLKLYKKSNTLVNNNVSKCTIVRLNETENI